MKAPLGGLLIARALASAGAWWAVSSAGPRCGPRCDRSPDAGPQARPAATDRGALPIPELIGEPDNHADGYGKYVLHLHGDEDPLVKAMHVDDQQRSAETQQQFATPVAPILPAAGPRLFTGRNAQGRVL